MNLRFSKRAEREVGRISAWWREERPSSPNLFTNELVEGLRLLQSSPEIGVAISRRRGTTVRRLMLEETRFHVYYAVDGSGIQVLSVWNATRGRAPRLS